MTGEQRPPQVEDAGDSQGLQVLARETFRLEGDVSRLITFLNQALKDEGFIFGLSLTPDGRYALTLYRV